MKSIDLKKKRIISFIFIIIILISPFIYFSKHLIKSEIPFFMDTLTQFYPIRMLIAEELRSLHLPFWNPYTYSGVPLLANPQWATFYPLNILFYIFPTPFVFTLSLIIHISIAGLGTFLYVKYITKSNSAGLLSGISIIFSSYFVSHIALIPHLFASSYIPLILLFTEMHIKTCRGEVSSPIMKGVVTTPLQIINSKNFFKIYNPTATLLFYPGLMLALQFLSGSPQISYYSFILLVMYYLIRSLQEYKGLKLTVPKYTFKLLTFILLTLIIIFGLSAIQLIPSIEFNAQCERAGKLPLETIKGSALNLQGICKSFLGGTGLPEDTDTINYFGFCNLLLIIIGIILLPNRYFLTFIIISLFALLYSSDFLSPLLYKIFPLYGRFHAPRRILVFLTFAGSIMAGLGFHNIRKMLLNTPEIKDAINYWKFETGNFKFKISSLQWLSILIVVVSLPFIIKLFLNPEINIILRSGIPYNFFLLISFIFFCIILFISILNRVRNAYMRSLQLMVFMIIIISASDLIIFSSRLEKSFISSEKIFCENETTKILKQEKEPFRFFSFDSKNSYSYDFRRKNFGSYLFPNLGAFYHLSDTQGYDPLIPKRYSEFLAVLNDGFVALYPSHFGLIRNPSSPLLDLLNVKYAIGDIQWYHPFFLQFKLSNNSNRVILEKVGKATKVEFTTILNNAMDIKDNENVCDITITSTNGKTAQFTLKAGTDTADWRIDHPSTYLKYKHSKAKFKEKWLIKESNVFFPTYDFYTAFDLPEDFIPHIIEFKGGLEKAEIAFLDIRFLLQDRCNKFSSVDQSSEIPIYKNNNFLPRIFAIKKIIPSNNKEETLSILKEIEINFSSSAIVEGLDKAVGNTFIRSLQDSPQIKIKESSNQNIVNVQSQSEKECFLVLSIPYFKGWKVKIDDKKTKIYITNQILQGVFVPGGNHLITFSYSPNSFYIGLVITTISIIIIGYWVMKVFSIKK